PRTYCATLKEHFGKTKLANITYRQIEQFKHARLATPTQYRRQRAIASVNRELALLRRMLNCAVRDSLITRNPFNAGDPLISTAHETKRERVISRDEEQRLLAACNPQVRPIVVAALDTGMRQGELTKLRFRDIDGGVINIIAFNTKTARGRTVPMTA